VRWWLAAAVCWVSSLAYAGPTTAGPAAYRALGLAGISAGDSLPTRIRKILHLLIDRNYLGAHADMPYELDSERTAEQVLSQHQGGACGSAAMAIAAILEASGVPDDSIRLVGTVTNHSYAVTCRKQGEPRVADSAGDGDGHIFVMVKKGSNQWILVDTTAREADYESAPIAGPATLRAAMARGPVPVPEAAYASIRAVPQLKDSFGTGLTLFALWKPSRYPIHSWADRLDLIASGTMVRDWPSDPARAHRCRYDPQAVLANRPRPSQPLLSHRALPPPATHAS
jgi:hypothetical protein